MLVLKDFNELFYFSLADTYSIVTFFPTLNSAILTDGMARFFHLQLS